MLNAVIPAQRSAEVVCMLDEFFEFPRPLVDATWGRGRFWSGQEVVGIDCVGAPPILADNTTLPLRDGAVGTLFYDPPHLPPGGPKSNWPGRGYGTAEWVWEGYCPEPHAAFLSEAARVVRRKDGLLVVKSADSINGRRPHWLTFLLHNLAEQAGFKLYDWVISYRQAPMISSKWTRGTYHAKKHHAHWLLFVPPGGPMDSRIRNGYRDPGFRSID